MRRIAFINEKGGTCKTTLCVNVGAYLARTLSKRVLVVDLDTQGHAGKSLGLDVRTLRPNVFDLLTDDSLTVNQVARATATPGLDVVPSNKAMSDFPLEVAARKERNQLLDRKMQGLSLYDYILYDAPPSMGLTTLNVMAACEEVVIPVALTYLGLDGCAEMVETVTRVARESSRPALHVAMVVPTLYRKTALADAILEKLRAYFPAEISATALGYSVKLDEAQSHGQTIWEYAPSCSGAKMIRAIADELVARSGQQATSSSRPAVASA